MGMGQAGIQVGNACWELYCLEHAIQITSGEELLCHHERSRKKIYHAVSIPGSLARTAASLPSLPPSLPIPADGLSQI
ncbi:hypothetical protein ZWY2020_049050 [Hordeum vulgare]|nr:hypothetical protein ZWY2020_049050 [Hordeum vulgare]